MTEKLGSWVDGESADRIPLDDRGLQYGDGLFETLLLRAGKARFLEQHLARLAHGCLRLGIPFDALDALRADIARAARIAPALAVLKVIVTRGSSARRGYSPDGATAPRRIVSLFETSPVSADVRSGARLRLAATKISANPSVAGLKHLNRLENVLAAGESAHAGVFESLLRDLDDRVVCGTMSNVFIVRGGQVITPPVERGGVAGVMRAVVLRECPVLGLAVQVREVTTAELTVADELFVTNARIGVVAAQSLGEHHFPMNHVALRLASHIETLDA